MSTSLPPDRQQRKKTALLPCGIASAVPDAHCPRCSFLSSTTSCWLLWSASNSGSTLIFDLFQGGLARLSPDWIDCNSLRHLVPFKLVATSGNRRERLFDLAAGFSRLFSLASTLSRCSGVEYPPLWIWIWLWVVSLSLPVTRAAGSVNVSIANTSPAIVYTPFLCNATSLISDPGCSGGWNASAIAGIPTVSTTGPTPDGADIVPQMFMAFRASALFMSTSAISNASANFTVTSSSLTLSRVVDSAAGVIAIVNLVESELTTLTITFVPGQSVSQLDIGSILMTVTDPDVTSSFLPTMTLPPSITLPTFIPQSTTASSSLSASPSSTSTHRSLAHRAQIAEALGLVLGLGVGLTLIAGAAFYWWKRRRRLQAAQQTNSWF
ncbi:hypothetical protein MVEN_01032800 [Mycena venus]|uniref:Uncharacterized protein n=1 Tax=Mycena venus TaxID=2733690 RepID=A0A8H7D2T7_9AGAR|nr:hypothetical protein MVEN_01032800 [Mycena venus]